MSIRHLRPRAAVRLGAISLAFISTAGADELLHGSRTVCLHAEEPQPRVIQVVYDNPDSPIPCKVLYEKSGATTEPGSAQNTAGVCERIERKIIGNLASAGYECEHAFIGALAASSNGPDRSITLDLFSEADATSRLSALNNTSDEAMSEASADVGVAADGAVAPSASALDGSDNTDQQDIAHIHHYSHSHPIGDPAGPSIEHTHTTTAGIGRLDDTDDSASTSSRSRRTMVTEWGVDALPSTIEATSAGSGIVESSATARSSDAGQATDTASSSLLRSRQPRYLSGQYALVSQSLPRQSDAQRLAGELKRRAPNVETRVVGKGDGGTGWQVSLGAGDDPLALEQALASLGGELGPVFSVVEISAKGAQGEPLIVAPSDWARYAVASCWADGQRTADEFARCADVVVDADAFVNCLGGGICTPQRFSEGMDTSAIDLASVLGADDPVAAARDRVTRRLEGCEQLSGASNGEFAECAALAVLDDDHRDVYDCYQRSASDIALLECAGNDTVADYARSYERCGTSGYEATTCLLENSDNDYLESAAYCVAYEDTSEIVSCGLDANLSDDNALMLSCLTDHVDSTDRTLCLARERLGEDEYSALQCAGLDHSVSEYGLCVGERSGRLSAETLAAARCLDGADPDARSLLDCAGGQYVSEDIGDCLDHGLDDPRCFEAETVMAQVANDALEDYLQVTALNNEIARYRQELYELDGGDIADMIKDNGGAGLVETETKVRKGLKGLLGF